MGIFLLGFFGPTVERHFGALSRAREFLEDIFLPARLSRSFFKHKRRPLWGAFLFLRIS